MKKGLLSILTAAAVLVGCQNYYEIAILDNALRAADDFCREYTEEDNKNE